MPSQQLQNIGLALQGFSAGLQGNLPQFQAMQNQRIQQEQEQAALQQQQRQAMVAERQKTMFVDADAALKLYDSGNIDGVVRLGLMRLQGLQQLKQQFPDIDPSDTQRLTQLAIAAKNGDEEAGELLKAELQSTVEIGQAIGVLQAPKPAEGATELGKLRQDLNSGLITQEQYDAAAKGAGNNLGIVQRFRKDGEAETILTDNRGNFFDLEGEPIALEKDDRIIEGSNLTGAQEELGLGSAESRDLRNAQVATTNFLGTVNDALGMLSENQDINTFVSRAASFVNDMQQEAKAIARQFDVDFDESLLSPEAHAETFDRLGVQNNRMRSIITSLAYNQALSNNPDGRVSNADLDRAIQEIGGSASDPTAFRQTLLDVAARADRNFRNNYRVRMQEDFSGDLGLGALSGYTGEGELTDAERAELEELRAKYGGR